MNNCTFGQSTRTNVLSISKSLSGHSGLSGHSEGPHLKTFKLILAQYKLTRPSVRVHWVACGTCTVPDIFFKLGGH